MTYTVRDGAFAVMRAFGMTTIFGNPGSTELPMFRDLPKDFRYVLGLQEAVVAGMADGFAQATRNAAFVNLHSAAGVGHAMGNIFTAFKNQTPMVITAGQQARSMMLHSPYLIAERATELPRPYVKWACEPARAEDVPAALMQAYHVAMQHPQGPTFVSVPVDDWDRPCTPPEIRMTSQSVRGDPALISALAADLDSAKRPALVVGAALARDDVWDDLIALAEAHEAEVWVAPVSARNAFPEDHRLFRGFLPAMREKIVALLAPNDAVFVLGAPAFSYHVEGHGLCIGKGVKLWHVTDDPISAANAVVGTALVSSMALAVGDILAASVPPMRSAQAPRRAVAQPAPAVPMTDSYLLSRLAQHRPAGCVIVEEAPSSRPAMHAHLPIIEAGGFYTCASGGLGHGLPAAIGIALGNRERRVIAIIGDGSAMYAIQALWTAMRLNVKLTILIVNNGRYEALHQFATLFGIDEPTGTDVAGIDFAAIAQAQGMSAIRVEDAVLLDQVLRDAAMRDGPFLIDAQVA